MGNACQCCTSPPAVMSPSHGGSPLPLPSPEPPIISSSPPSIPNTSTPPPTIASLMLSIQQVNPTDQIDPLINFVEEQLRRLKATPANASTSSSPLKSVASSTSLAATIVDTISTEAEKLGKTDIAKEMGSLALSGLKKVGEAHWIFLGLSVAAYALERCVTERSNVFDCIDLLQAIVFLAKDLKRFKEAMPGESERLCQAVQIIVEGAIMCADYISKRKLSRTFKGHDIPANVARKAPKFCSVYVISKGKLTSVHSNISSVQDCDSYDEPKVHSSINSQDTTVSREMAEETSSDSSESTAFQSKHLLVQRNRALSCDDQTLCRSLANSANNALVVDEPIYRSQSIGTVMHKTPTASTIQIKDANEGGMYFESSTSSLSRSSGATGEELQSFSSPHSDAELVTCGQKLEMKTNHESDNLSFVNGGREHEMHDNELEELFVEKENNRKASPNVLPDIETQLERLQIEVKSTQEMYMGSLKHVIAEKNNAEYLSAQLIEESRKVEEVKAREKLAMAVAAEYIAQCEGDMKDTETARQSTVKEEQQRKDAELRAIRDSYGRKKAQDALQSAEERYRKYSIEEIEMATDFFSESLKIGEGGYGPVYKGSLDHTAVAIKVLKTDAERGRLEFQQEVEILSRIHHPHMVMLLGTCTERGCLVYEYMANGSLDDCLFGTGANASLPWFVRFRIASEIALALLFLHTTKPEPIVHRDLKPANILLDQNFVSKIGDVGLARLVPPTVSSAVTEYKNTILGGTFFYIDPEYQRTGILRPKSDVYALGIILLQLLTAKPAMALANRVETAIINGSMREILDNSAGDWPFEEAMDLAKLGLKCTELRRRDRPDLEKVVLPELERFRDVANAYVQRSKIQRGIAPPSYFLCPILQEVMEDPYVAADGVTYEYKAIKAWLDKNKSPPMGNPKLPQKKLIRNHSLRSAILEWRIRKNAHPLSQLQRKQSNLKNQGQA